MQYFQAVQQGRQRAAKSQMKLFDIAGFAMLTLTTKKVNELRKLRNMLAHEDTIAGGYDLMDIVALKVIERSRIKTRILKADTAILERVIKGGSGGTEIIHSKKKRAR